VATPKTPRERSRQASSFSTILLKQNHVLDGASAQRGSLTHQRIAASATMFTAVLSAKSQL